MHVPVLAGAAVQWLRIGARGTYVDCTAGAGGHSALIAERLEGGRLISLDCDAAAAAMARSRLAGFGNAAVYHRNYAELAALLAELGVEYVDGILFDLGVSSMQLDTPERGFSFQREGPLDMRMDVTQGPTVGQFLADANEAELARTLRDYGDVRPARKIARHIIDRRDRGKLASTEDLAGAVAEALPFVTGVPEETRTVFQALRMAVNEELPRLESGLKQAVKALAPLGRVVVITFHSGEDRIAKCILRDAARPQRILHPDGRVKETRPPSLKLLTRKPLQPDEHEIRENPRAHSAKLRAAERLGAAGRLEFAGEAP